MRLIVNKTLVNKTTRITVTSSQWSFWKSVHVLEYLAKIGIDQILYERLILNPGFFSQNIEILKSQL